MSEYFETIINARTGEVTRRDWTPEEIANDELSRAPTVPAEITKVQFVRAARAAGLWDAYKDSIEAHPDWPYITSIPRNDSLVLQLAAGLGFTSEQLDSLWIAGKQL